MIKSAERAPAARHDRDQHDESTRAQPNQPVADQLPVPVAGTAFPVQAKLLVGSAADSSEIEAERVAMSVVEALRRHSEGADPISGWSAPLSVLHRHADHEGAESGVIGAAGGEVDREMEATLHASAGSGSSLTPPLRAQLETVLGADLSGIRLHADATAGQLNRAMSASAFTHGRDVYFRDGLPDTRTDSGLHLLAHELTHTVQQGSAPLRRSALTPAEPRAGEWTLAEPIHVESEDDGVHRHSAFEHYLLGQLQPAELAKIPAVRDAKDNKKQKKKLKQGHDEGLSQQVTDDQTMQEVRHLIDQELQRLLAYRKDPEALEDRLGEKGRVSKTIGHDNQGQRDDTWQVPIVVLPCSDDEIVVTYSEMNTLPDLFGNPEAIARTPKDKVLGLLQGVRQQLYIELTNMRKEIFGEADNTLHHKARLDEDFTGARGPRAQAVNDTLYMVRMEGQVNADTTRKGDEAEQYFAALERNACHFAPQSWHQWRGYHDKAIDLARQAKKLRELAIDMRDVGGGDMTVDKVAAEYEEEATDLANKALIQNSFGEHYLQDSFASGHLIDKTQIMQWFTIWLADSGKELGMTASAAAAFAMALHAANSELKSNPQALHDKFVRGEVVTGTDADAEIGMTETSDIVLMMRWRALAKAKRSKRTLTIKQAAEEFGLGMSQLEKDLDELVAKRFATVDDGSRRSKNPFKGFGKIEGSEDKLTHKYTLDKEMVDVLSTGKKERRGKGGQTGRKVAYSATRGSGDDTGKISDEEALAAAAEFNLASYSLLLGNAYIGGATKYFHDKFCQEGLEVVSGKGDEIGRIYGDQNMLNAGGQSGVEYAAETSRMSREAVFDILDGGEANHTAEEIEERFPKQVYLDGTKLSLVDFNEELNRLGRDEGLFKKAAMFGSHFVYKIQDGISSRGALDVKKLASDVPYSPHDVF